jgi:hypothetical protein
MKRVLVIFAFLLAAIGPVFGTSLHDATLVNIKTYKLNLVLRDVYSSSLLKNGTSKVNVDLLNDSLRQLYDLNASLAETTEGEGVERIRENTRIYRALAWLHGWAAFNQYLYRASSPGADNTLRRELLDKNGLSAFEQLISVYAQIADTENNKTNPLQRLLKNETQLSHLLAFRERWLDPSEKANSGVIHNFYIPSSIDILGTPSDMISAGRIPRNLLSVWGVINLQIDTWHNNRLDPQTGSIPPDSTSTEKIDAKDLSRWLLSITPSSLGQFGDSVARSRLSKRANKIGHFLNWREENSDESRLRSFVQELYNARKPGGDLKAAFGELFEAAESDDMGESLYDATYWARYVFLLSVKMPRRSLQNPAAIENSWNSLGLGPFSVDRPNVPKRDGFLRWNQQPPNGAMASLLLDLTNATWGLFGFERKARGTDFDQFANLNRSFYSNNTDKSKLISLANYSSKLTQNLSDLRLVFQKFVEPYFVTKGTLAAKSDTDYFQKLLLADPTRLTTFSDEYTQRFRGTTTISEQKRVVGDFVTIAGEIRSTFLLYSMIRDAYNKPQDTGDTSDIGFALQYLQVGIPYSSGQIYQLPTKSFNEYMTSLQDHITDLRSHMSVLVAAKELKSNYRSKKARLEAAQLRLRAARIGTKVLEKAEEISEKYRKIADIGVEISALEKQSAQYVNNGFTLTEESSNRKLAQVERLRDLAAAQVDALEDVTTKAIDILNDEVNQLNGLQQQYNQLASEQKKREEATGLINALKIIVTVVGIALAPFTGGASFSVAMIVNQAIDIYQKLSQVNWSNFGDAVIGIGNAAESIGQAIDTGVSTFGSAEAKKSLGDAKKFLNESRSDIENVAATTRKLLETIGNLPKDKIGGVATALSNGYPVSIGQNGKLNFDFGDKKIVFADDSLRKDLKAYLDKGGIILNDLRLRNSDLIKLPEITDDQQFRDKLTDTLDLATKQLPPELLEKWKAQSQAVKDQKKAEFDTAVSALKNRARNLSTPIKDLRLLGQAIVGGWLVVSDDEVTVSVLAPPITKEAAQFKTRLEVYKNSIQQKILSDLIEKFSKTRDEIIAAGEKASNSSDGLLAVANSVPGYISKTRSDATQIASALEDAKEKFEETKNQVEIANYDREAAENFRKASEIRIKEADESVKRAALEQEIALTQYELQALKSEEHNLEVQAAVNELQAADLDFERTYESCLEAGFDPLSDDVDGQKLIPPSPVTLKGFLSGHELGDNNNYDKLLVAQAADDLIGLLQWLAVVSADGDNPTPAAYFADIVSKSIYEEPKNLPDQFLMIRNNIRTDFENRTKPPHKRLTVKIAEDNTNDITKINWFINLPKTWSDNFLTNYGIPETERSHVLGYIRFRLQHDNGTDDGRTLYFSLGKPGNAYYVDVNQISVTCKECANLRFLPIPPRKPLANLGSMSIGVTGSDMFSSEFQILTSDDVVQIKSDIRKNLEVFQNLSLTGALGSDKNGDWTILIIDPTFKSPEQIKTYVNLLGDSSANKFHFVAGYLESDASK